MEQTRVTARFCRRGTPSKDHVAYPSSPLLCHDGMPQLRVEATAVLLRELHQSTVRRVRPLIMLHYSPEFAQSLRDFRLQIQHAAVDRDEQVRKATAAIDTITDSRIRRADLLMGQERLDELNEGLANLRRENDRGLQTCFSPSGNFPDTETP
jgi:hypothetical protein